MSTIDVQEVIPDHGHDSASAAAATEPRKRQPRYKVLERAEVFTRTDLRKHLAELARDMLVELGAPDCKEAAESIVESVASDAVASDGWFEIGHEVDGATDRLAIQSVIGTHESPVEGFDADRRLLPHVAVLSRHWQIRRRKREVTELTTEERAVLEAQLAPKVSEGWE